MRTPFVFGSLALVFVAQSALAQSDLPALPPSDVPAPAPVAPSPVPATPPAQPAPAAPPPEVYLDGQRAVPTPAEVEPEEPTHAPKYSLWLGARASLSAYSGAFYNELETSGNRTSETTGNLASPEKGFPAVQLDLGARLSKRYVPYVFWEHQFLSHGRRFFGTDGGVSSNYVGLGFRYTAFDADTVGFLTDLSAGYRWFSMNRGGETYTLSTIEFLRFGIGAEIRLATRFVLSPLAFLTAGSMTDASGTVQFNDGTRPRYAGGSQIDEPRGYVIVGIGCGFHTDLIGK